MNLCWGKFLEHIFGNPCLKWLDWNLEALSSTGTISNSWTLVFKVMLLINTHSSPGEYRPFALAPTSVRKESNNSMGVQILNKMNFKSLYQ